MHGHRSAPAKNPQVLLLNEATSALGNESARRMVRAMLHSDRSTMGHSVTTISVAHRVSTVTAADRLRAQSYLLLRSGK